ncbi:putative reverse transcriptase domain-containing protein [Tanacetum coccineum]
MQVMTSPIISISSYSSDESVGSHVPRVILFGTIPTSIPVIHMVPAEVPIAPANPLVASEVGAIFVISPTRVLDLVDYSSSSNSDPSEDSLPIAPELPLVSPFLCTDDSEADSESEPAEKRPDRHESLTPSFEFPLALVVAPPGIRRRPVILVQPGEAIPFGRPYRTHPNGPRKLLTARKRVGPFPARRLAWRCVSHRSSDRHSSPDITSDSSSSSSSSDSSLDISSGCDALESSLGLSSERSLDSSSPSARPSRKRCRSPTTLVPSSTPVLRSIALALADLPPHKRFRDSYSLEGVGAHTEDGIDMGVEVATSDIREDEEDFEVEASTGGMMEIAVDLLATGGISEPTREDAPDLEGTLYDISHYKSEVPLDRITEFETAQRQLEADHVNSLRRYMALSQEEFRHVYRDHDDTQRRLRRKMTNTRSRMTPAASEEMINRRMTEALETRKANMNIRLTNDNDEGGNGKGNDNGHGGGNGNGNHNENDRDARPVVQKCTYQDFMKCQPLNFKGTKGVVGLISALPWWNLHKRTIGTDASFVMSWRELMKLMAEVYCPRTKIQKMEYELWNLAVKNNDLASYTQIFQELTILCTKMVPEEEDQVEKFIGGLLDNIQGNVIVAEPTRLQDAVCMANNLMDQKLKGYAIKNAENKRKFDNSQKDNSGQQPPFKRHNVGVQNVSRAYTAGNNEKRVYNGTLPLCNKCKFHHEGTCTVRCGKCNKVVHLTRDCKAINSTTSNQRACSESESLNLFRVWKARTLREGKAYVLGGGDVNPDSKVVTGTFLLNNHYASVLFDSGVDRSFVSTTFSTLLDIIPDTLDVSYSVELADGRVSETSTVVRDCTLGFLGNPFNIDLIPVELGSFDVIIGMDWLVNHHAVIVCDEKIVRIPYGDEVLIVQGDRNGKGKKSKLSIISCTTTQKYIKKGCLIFLAQVMKKETEDKSEENRLKDVPTRRDFLEVFPEDLPGLPPT